jgi:hypothetical protein
MNKKQYKFLNKKLVELNENNIISEEQCKNAAGLSADGVCYAGKISVSAEISPDSSSGYPAVHAVQQAACRRTS